MGIQGAQQRSIRGTVGLGAVVVAGALVAAAAPASAALSSVPPRGTYETNRIDSPEAAALPDGRVVVGWFNGTNNGDTTLAMIRPAGGLLPMVPQVLRTGYSGEDFSFTRGGPANDPVLITWQDGDSRTPFRVKLDGLQLTTQTPIFSGTYGTGRFPRYVRCPDGSTVFSYQFTNTGPPASYTSSARFANADGSFNGGSFGSASTPDYYQDPTVTCDRGVPLFATAIAADDQQGAVAPEQLRVQHIGPGGGTLLNTPTKAPHAYAGAPDARVAPDGRVWIKWSESPVNPSSDTKTYLTTRAPGATGALPVPASPFFTEANAYVGDFFFDAAGNTHLLISRESASGTSYAIRTAPAGSATFGPEQPLLPAGEHYVRLLTDHPDGNPRLLVIKQGPAPDYKSAYELRGIPQAGSGDSVTPISFDGVGFPSATFLPAGDLFIVGVEEPTPTTARLVEGGLDTGVPPTIDAIKVPGLAGAGEPTDISVDARDPLGLGSFSWTVTGGALPAPITLGTQHATIPALQPGTYEVKARAVDRVGAATEVTRALRVLDPAAVTPGTTDFSDAVARGGGAVSIDRTPPGVTKLTATRGRSGKAKRTVTMSVTVDEGAAADVEALGTLKKGKARGTLILASRAIRQLAAGKATELKFAVPASLAKLVKDKLSLRVTVTDLAGNRTQQTVAVKVAKAPKKK